MKRASKTENEAKYLGYIEQLKATDRKFPATKEGDANLTEIARQCGFGRDRLYKNQSLVSWLKEDLKYIGIDGGSDQKVSEEYLTKKAAKMSKDASKLRTELDAKSNEVEALREEIEELRAEIKKLKQQKSESQEAMDELEVSGRRSFFR